MRQIGNISAAWIFLIAKVSWQQDCTIISLSFNLTVLEQPINVIQWSNSVALAVLCDRRNAVGMLERFRAIVKREWWITETEGNAFAQLKPPV